MLELPSVADMPLFDKGKRRIKENVVNFEIATASSTLLNNFLEKDLQSLLMPIHIMLISFFCAKYKIWEQKITPNSASYNIITFLAMLALLYALFYYMLGFSLSTDLRGFQYLQYLNKAYVFFLLITGSFLNICMNVIQKYNNVYVILKIQNVFRILKIRDVFKCFIVPNWVCVTILNCFHVCWVLYSYYNNYELNVVGIGISFMTYCFITFDMTILYTARIMKLLTKPLKSWVKNVKKSKRVQNSEMECYWNTMFEVYTEILEAYQIFEKTFHQMILFYTIHTTSKSLFAIAIRIEQKKVSTENEVVFALLSFLSLTWIIKNMVLLTCLCVESEKFYAAMKEVQSVCVQLVNSNRCPDIQRQVCKNIQRLHINSFRKMHACGLFNIDARLPLSLAALITTYTIVILQSEFL